MKVVGCLWVLSGCLADWVGGLLVIACEAAMLMDSSSLGSSILLSTSCMTHSLYLQMCVLVHVQHFHIEQESGGEDLTGAHTGLCDYRAAPLWAVH